MESKNNKGNSKQNESLCPICRKREIEIEDSQYFGCEECYLTLPESFLTWHMSECPCDGYFKEYCCIWWTGIECSLESKTDIEFKEGLIPCFSPSKYNRKEANEK